MRTENTVLRLTLRDGRRIWVAGGHVVTMTEGKEGFAELLVITGDTVKVKQTCEEVFDLAGIMPLERSQ